MDDFERYPKIPRLRRDMLITEKIDGTNAQVYCVPQSDLEGPRVGELKAWAIADVAVDGVPVWVLVGSRNRWVNPSQDNHGFAAWVYDHAEELAAGLGPGRHYGEWWGQGIQRNYGMGWKVFSLFNVFRWIPYGDENYRDMNLEWLTEAEQEKLRPAPSCCSVVPIIYRGPFSAAGSERQLLKLRKDGSYATRRFGQVFDRPEGIVVCHLPQRNLFKMTFEGDEEGKSCGQ